MLEWVWSEWVSLVRWYETTSTVELQSERHRQSFYSLMSSAVILQSWRRRQSLFSQVNIDSRSTVWRRQHSLYSRTTSTDILQSWSSTANVCSRGRQQSMWTAHWLFGDVLLSNITLFDICGFSGVMQGRSSLQDVLNWRFFTIINILYSFIHKHLISNSHSLVYEYVISTKICQ